MLLKLKRSQKTGGVMTTNVIFCLDARIEFTPFEAQDISRYKLASQVIYNSEASKRLLEKGTAQQDGSAMGNLRGLVTLAMVSLKLNISIASLQRGQHIECKSLDELLGAEEAIMEACENLKRYLLTASAFDGREILIDFNDDSPRVVAEATTPNPQLIAPALTYMPGEPTPDTTQLASAAQANTLGLPFDWNDPDTRKKIMIVCAIILLILLLRTCHVN